MKHYNDLTDVEKVRAEGFCLNRLLSQVASGSIRFNDALNGDNLQARIDKATETAEKLGTPWFAGECIMETCKEELQGMARCEAEDALYPEPNERVILDIVD